MRKTLLTILILLTAFGINACASKGENMKNTIVSDAKAEYYNGENKLVITYKAESLEFGEDDLITIKQSVTNNTELKITRIGCSVVYYDKDGKILAEKKISRSYREEPLLVEETGTFYYAQRFENSKNTAYIEVRVDFADTELETPPLAQPVINGSLFEFYNSEEITAFADNFYIDTPVKLEYFKANIIQTETEDTEVIKAVFEAMKNVKSATYQI